MTVLTVSCLNLLSPSKSEETKRMSLSFQEPLSSIVRLKKTKQQGFSFKQAIHVKSSPPLTSKIHCGHTVSGINYEENVERLV